MIKIISINILIFSIVTSLAFLFFDLGSKNDHVLWQGFGYHRFDEQLGYTHNESIPFDVTINKYIAYRGKINSHGFRGKEISPKLESIYFAGDSQIFGWGLDDEYSISEQLSKRITKKFNYINGGVAGYGTDQSYKRFLDTRKKLPKIKHLFFFLNYNDIESYNTVEMLLYEIRNGKIQQKDMRKSFVLWARKFPLKTNSPIFRRYLTNLSTYLNIFYTYYESFNKEKSYKKILTAQLTKLKELSEKEEFTLSIIELPNLKGKTHFKWVGQKPEFAAHYTDLNPITKFHKSEYYLHDRDHFNKEGASLVAKELQRLLK